MLNRIADLEGLVAQLSLDISEIQAQIRGFTEPPPDIEIPPFPRVLRRMGYKPPDGGSIEKANA